MTTRAGLRALLREGLADVAAWPDATLNAWINDALRDYSNAFPRHLEAAIAGVAGQVVYPLSGLAGIQGVLTVECPAGAEPACYLARRPEQGTFRGLPVYDLRGEPPVALVLGAAPAAGQAILLRYTALHPLPTHDSAALTVPESHQEALKLFVQWQAIKLLELNQAANPDTTSLLLSMLGLNAVRAERLYRGKLEEYRKLSTPGGYAGPWRMDRSDRVY